jgi:hypothetical protein
VFSKTKINQRIIIKFVLVTVEWLFSCIEDPVVGFCEYETHKKRKDFLIDWENISFKGDGYNTTIYTTIIYTTTIYTTTIYITIIYTTNIYTTIIYSEKHFRLRRSYINFT